ncbi:MAG: hypothetical protein ACJAZV_001404 [Roseivirga sp.]|jgi:hypothetical protein
MNGKYLKYAIGEIVLVVVGILLALYINNLNEERKNRQTEQDILENLKTELLKIQSDLEETIQRHQWSHKAGLTLLGYFGKDISTPPVRTLDSLLSLTETAWTFESRDGYIKSIIATGNIDYIRNEQLKSLLTAYEGSVEDATEENKKVEMLYHDRLWPTIDGKINLIDRLKAYGPQYNAFPNGSYQSDYQWFFQSRIVEDIISNIEGWRVSVMQDEQKLMVFLNEMVDLIDVELK